MASSHETHPWGGCNPSLPLPVHGDAVTGAREMANMGPGSLSIRQGAGNTANTLRQALQPAAWLHQAGAETMKESGCHGPVTFPLSSQLFHPKVSIIFQSLPEHSCV